MRYIHSRNERRKRFRERVNMLAKEASNKQEMLVANYLGFKQVSGSGARNFHPGDVVGDEWLCECKTHVTPGHQLVFSFSVWDKIEIEASSQFKHPVLITDDGSQDLNKTFCMIKLVDFSIPDGFELRDYSKSSSIRRNVNTLRDFDIADAPFLFIRNREVYALMSIRQFKKYVVRN